MRRSPSAELEAAGSSGLGSRLLCGPGCSQHPHGAWVWGGGAYLQSCLGLGMYPGYESSVIILHILLSRSEGRRVPDLTRSPRQWSKVLRSSGPSSVKKQWPKEL